MEVSEILDRNASDDEVRRILTEAKTIAVVGLSDKPDRDSHRVAAYLKQRGYRIIPVNPNVKEVLGEPSRPNLRQVSERIDVVDIFRRSEAVPEIVDDAIRAGAKTVWMQEGIVHHEAAQKARHAGLQVVMDRCILKEHRRLIGSEGG